MAKSFLSGRRTCLSKLLGVFTIVVKAQGGLGGAGGGKESKEGVVLDLLIQV